MCSSNQKALQDVEITPGLAGGGFVTGADDVVQAYQLPKAFLLSSGANSIGPSGAASDSEAVAEQLTYDLETMDVDSDPGIEDEQPAPRRPVKAPKTMKQLAEETSARLNKEFARHDIEDDVEEMDIPLPPVPTASAPKAKKTRQAKPSRAPSERNPTKTKAKVGAAAARRASARKRRRSNGTDSDSEGEDSEPSPAKRAKAGNGVPAPVAAAQAPSRSLRPRRTKTQTELQEEAERERAFQRAVAK
jgi:xeroderma pigmentosum group C-complementing protein